MSSFLVNEQTMNNILSNLGSAYKSYSDEQLGAMGRRFYLINSEALVVRYGDKIEQYNRLMSGFEFKRSRVSIMQSIKNVQCLLYQCSEGEITKSDGFKEIKEIEEELMNKFFNRSDEYEMCEWDSQ